MTKNAGSTAHILPLPTTEDLRARATELRYVLNLEDDCRLSEIRTRLEEEREEALDNFEISYLCKFSSIIDYLTE